MLQFFDTVILPSMDQCHKLSVELIFELERTLLSFTCLLIQACDNFRDEI